MYLCEYHVIVVNLCRELVIYTQKSAVSLIVSSLNPSLWNTYQMSLEQWSTYIKEEISSLVTQTIEHESSLNSGFRIFVTGEMKKQSLMKQLNARRRGLDACTTHDYEMTFRQQRKLGTTDFFPENNGYKCWKAAASSGTLIVGKFNSFWFYYFSITNITVTRRVNMLTRLGGKLGSGKTVMLTNIIDDLRKDAATTHANVAYFFCRHDIPDSLKERVILGSLAREILRNITDLSAWERILESLTTSTSTIGVHNVLLQHLPADSMTYFVIDGIDECKAETVECIWKTIKILQRLRRLAICVSFRTPANLRFDLLNQTYMDMPEDNSDIDNYIAAELERRVESGSLTLGDPTLIKEIYTTLVTGAKGMFLWASLQIECLCFQKSDKQIRIALSKLPRGLPDLFARLLYEAAKDDDDAKHDQIRVLELVVSAVRPLQEEEMREALSVIPGNTNWDASQLVNNIRSLLVCCGSLLILDEEDRSIRLIHHSVLQHLEENYRRLDGSLLAGHTADKSFAAILITYLNYRHFETQISKQHPKLPMDVLQTAIVQSTINSNTKRRLTMQILKRISRSSCDARQMVDQEVTRILESKPSTDSVFHLYDYAKNHLMDHAWVYFNTLEDPIVSLLSSLTTLNKEVANVFRQNIRELELFTWNSKHGQALAILDLLCEGVSPLLDGLPSIFESRTPSKSRQMTDFLEWACAKNCHNIVLRWLRKVSKYNIPYPEKSYGKAICSALINANNNIASDVVEHVAELNTNLSFLRLWLPKCQPVDTFRFSNSAERRIKFSVEILDSVLLHDNNQGLRFLLDCNMIYCNKLCQVMWEGAQFRVSLYEHCLLRDSKKCCQFLKTVQPAIMCPSSDSAENTAICYKLLCNAIRFDGEDYALQAVGWYSFMRHTTEDERLQCLNLAVEYNMVRLATVLDQKFLADFGLVL